MATITYKNASCIYEGSDKLAVDSQSLVNTIRSDPKKYLTIHFKVF